MKPKISEEELADAKIFPHLKECGPIEATARQGKARKFDGFPHLKECGPIEARGLLAVIGARIFDFPHLKECGPIEAQRRAAAQSVRHRFSALERVRPH